MTTVYCDSMGYFYCRDLSEEEGLLSVTERRTYTPSVKHDSPGGVRSPL